MNPDPASRNLTDRLKHDATLQAMLSTFPDVMLIFDGEIRYRNVFTSDHSSLIAPADEIIGKRLRDVMPESEAKPGEQAILQVLKTGEMMKLENALTIDGKTRWFSARVVRYEDAGEYFALWVTRDITELKLAQEKQQEDERLLRDLLSLQEKALQLLSCELHDGLLQQILGARLYLESLCFESELDSAATLKVQQVVDLLRTAIGEGRRLIEEHRPLSLDNEDIDSAIRLLVDDAAASSDRKYKFLSSGNFQNVSGLMKGNVFRIIQECLTNISKHANAMQVEVEIHSDGQQISISVSDDGIGYRDRDVEEGSFGLRSLVRRTELFGGTVRIRSQPGKGTHVDATLPIEG